jgi:hypothetical protein
VPCPGPAVWNLAAPAVIRPHRDGWLELHMRPLRDAEAAADALLAGHHGNGCADQAWSTSGSFAQAKRDAGRPVTRCPGRPAPGQGLSPAALMS